MKSRFVLSIACSVLVITSSVINAFGGIVFGDLRDKSTPCVEAKDSGEKVDNGVIVYLTGVIVYLTGTGVIVYLNGDKDAGSENCGIIITD